MSIVGKAAGSKTGRAALGIGFVGVPGRTHFLDPDDPDSAEVADDRASVGTHNDRTPAREGRATA